MNSKKIRIKVENKVDFGTAGYCKKQLEQLSSVFLSDELLGYGLERNAKTFDDLMNGGNEAINQYRERLEKELPVNSVLSFIAKKAKRDVEEGVDVLKRYIASLSKARFYDNIHAMTLSPDHVRFDEESNSVVLTDRGQEALENELGYYITNQVQLDIFNLANDVKKKYDELSKRLKRDAAVNVRDVLEIDSTGRLFVKAEKIVQIS